MIGDVEHFTNWIVPNVVKTTKLPYIHSLSAYYLDSDRF